MKEILLLVIAIVVFSSVFQFTAFTQEPSKAKKLSDEGMVYFQKGNFDKAMEYLNKAIAIDPNYAVAYGFLGAVYFQKGNINKAKNDFEKHSSYHVNKETRD